VAGKQRVPTLGGKGRRKNEYQRSNVPREEKKCNLKRKGSSRDGRTFWSVRVKGKKAIIRTFFAGRKKKYAIGGDTI